MNKATLVFLALVVVLAEGCSTASGPARTKLPTDAGATRDNAYLKVNDDYRLGFIEFDEQGDFWSRKLASKVIEDAQQFAETAKQTKNQTLLVIYIHGWQNNARSGDVRNFETFLASLRGSLVGIRGKKVAVYGVYIGWRGRLLPTPHQNDALSRFVDDTVYAVPKLLTFWTREAAGERVAKLSSTEAILRLTKAVEAGDPNARSIVIGHSFGALVAENSLAQATLSRVYGNEAQGSTTRPPVDLTVLLNQAAPSMTAKRLQEALLDAYVASKTTPPVEQPMIVSVTSTDDNATRRAFPIARFFETILARGRGYGDGAERSQHTYMRQTAGHLPSMYTHRVVKRDSEGSISLPSLPLVPSPLQSAPPPATTELMSKQNQAQLVRDRLRPDWEFQTKDQTWFVKRQANPVWRTPYWIVSVDRDFIKGHGGVWNDNVVQFVISLVQRNQLLIEEPTLPIVEQVTPTVGLLSQR